MRERKRMLQENLQEISQKIEIERRSMESDPISQYLFIIMAKALGRMINRNKKSGQIHGMKPGPNCDPISHHQFVDDMFGKASVREDQNFMSILKLYEKPLHEKVNFQKIQILFFNTLLDKKKKIAQILKC